MANDGIINALRRRVSNAFSVEENSKEFSEFGSYGTAVSIRPDRSRVSHVNEKSIIESIITRISIDAASVPMRHVMNDDQDRYLKDMDSGLNECLTVQANIDQAASMFRQDLIYTMCSEGVIAVVPVDTTSNPAFGGSYDILTMRVGTVTAWFPRKVRVKLYNDNTGKFQEIVLRKENVAIVENPLYAVMNEKNSTLQRVLRKLTLLDAVDEQSASGKLDLIIQLPYTIKSEARRQQAKTRRDDIEFQLKGSKYGIAYTDGTEKITQLNRPSENNLLAQVEYLMAMLYGQLGITKSVMDGNPSEEEMINYWNRTIEPILRAISEELKRKFLTKTARTQKQSVETFRDPFALILLKDFAEIADKLTRNEVATSNELRQAIGMKPSGDPKADKLINANMPVDKAGFAADPQNGSAAPVEGGDVDAQMTQSFDDADATISEIEKMLGEPDEEDANVDDRSA